MFQYTAAQGWWQTVVPILYGREQCSKTHKFGPAVRQHYLLHYVLDGEGFLHKGGQVYSVSKGDLFVILPGEVTTYWADQIHPWQYAWVGFYAEGTPPFLQTAVIRQPQVRQCFEKIQAFDRNAETDGNLFAVTFAVLQNLYQQSTPEVSETNSYASRAKTYLETSYMYSISIENLAESLHIDRRYLTRLFHDRYGISPQEYLMTIRLDHARTFLQQGYGVTETASMVGFTDLSNFSKRYKARFGISPSMQK